MITPKDLRASQLEPDMRVGEWAMPWSTRADSKRLGPGVPKLDFRPSWNQGIDQVACVYTAQGFEFDFVGAIFGLNPVYRLMDARWAGQRHESRDWIVTRGVTEAEFTVFIKSSHRVLPARGLRGCSLDSPLMDRQGRHPNSHGGGSA